MEAFIEKFRYKPTKAKQVQDRVKKLEKIERIVVPQEKKTVHFNFVQPPRTGDMVVRCSGAGQALRRETCLRWPRFVAVSRREGWYRWPERRRQIDASENDRGRASCLMRALSNMACTCRRPTLPNTSSKSSTRVTPCLRSSPCCSWLDYEPGSESSRCVLVYR